MLNVQQELAAQRVESKLYFDVKRFFGMLLVRSVFVFPAAFETNVHQGDDEC